MKNFGVTSQTVSRIRRRLLAETWTVAFDIVSTTASSASQATTAVFLLTNSTFEASIQTLITTISSFATPVNNNKDFKET